MTIQAEIPCPDCGNKVFVNTGLLLTGSRFSCSNPSCGVSVSLHKSSYQVAATAVEQFEQMKSQKIGHETSIQNIN